MTIDQLRMLIAVAETGTLKAASARLHKTQPAISQGIAKLEQQLGVKLFLRDSYRLSLTNAGQQILRHAKRVLFETEQLSQIAGHFAQGNETQINIAFEASFNLSLILPTLESIQQRFPDTRIVLNQEYISGAYGKVLQGQADIALTPVMAEQLQTQALNYVSLYQGALLTSAAPKLLARHPSLSHAHQLRDEYQIVIKDTGTDSEGFLMGVMDSQRTWYASDFSTKKMLIISGMGWGKLPDFMIQPELDNGALVQLELEGISTTVKPVYRVLKHQNKVLGPVGQALWDAISELAQPIPTLG